MQQKESSSVVYVWDITEFTFPTDITLIPVSTLFVLSSYMHACPENLCY